MSGGERTGAKLVKAAKYAENAILAGLLGLLIFVAVLKIVQRNLTGGGPAWSDELQQVLVLWIGLFGAMAAAREANHINIDVLSRFLHHRIASVTKALAALFTVGVCGVAAWCGYTFVASEYSHSVMMIGRKVPSWTIQTIIPVAFAIIALRYLGHFITHVYRAFHGGED